MPLRSSFSVSSIAELANYNNSHCEILLVNDVERTSGNPFRWAGNALKANGGTIQQGLGGVWEMMFDGPVNVNWFGALPNERDVTKEFQRAVDFAYSKGKPVYVPGKPEPYVYRLSQINLHDNSVVFGDYRRTIIIPASHNVLKIFNIEGTDYNTNIKTFINIFRLTIVNQLNHGPISTGCIGINFKFCDEVQLSELIVDGFEIDINIENSKSIFGNKLRLRSATKNNLKIRWTKKDGPPYVGTWVTMNECEFSGGILAHAESEEKYSVYVENYASVILDKCVVVGNKGGGVKFTQTYLSPAEARDMTYILVNNCDIDSNDGLGIKGEYTRNCIIKGNWVASGRENKVSGIHLYKCQSSSIADNQCFLNGGHGILIDNCSFLIVSSNICGNNGLVSNASNAGIKVVDSSNNNFNGNICNNKQYGWKEGKQNSGIEETGNSNYNIYNSNILQPNINPLNTRGKNNTKNNNIF